MRSINRIMSITAGVLAMIYDLWVIQAGHLPAVGLLLAACARHQQMRRGTEGPVAIQSQMIAG